MPSPACVRAATATSQTQDHQSRLRRRGRPARLYRAHQYPRQHAHARLRDPARIRYRRRRRLQPRAGRPRRAAAEEPRTTSRPSRSPTSRARRPIASSSTSTSRSSRPASSRSPAAIRPPTASSPKSASPSATCWAAASIAKASVQLRPAHARLRAVVRRAVSPRLPPGRRHRPLRQADAGDVTTSPTTRRRSAANLRLGFALTEELSFAAALFDLPAGNHAAGSSATTVQLSTTRLINACTGVDAGIEASAASTADRRADDELLRRRRSLAARCARNWRNGPVLGVAGRLYARLQHARQQQERRPAASTPSSSRTSPASAAT